MDPSKMMGFESPGDQRVPVPVRDWNAMKLALWRSRTGWEIVARQAAEILSRCAHMEGCAGNGVETEPCLPHCPDRELRMSALVILNAARTLSPADARRPANEPYTAPSREYFSEVIAELGATQIEAQMLREALRAAGVEPPLAQSAQIPQAQVPSAPRIEETP